ncbi:UDP-glucose--hexose-1-phosphate uridylyltransferase [Colwelliaceae bacterium BS250]
MSSLEFTHRRKNPLTGDWVLVSPHRNNRPWSGATEADSVEKLSSYDKSCPLCPSNERANDTFNPDYKKTFVFVNDFGALVSDNDNVVNQDTPAFIKADVARGECRVICFSPDHSKTLPELSNGEIKSVIDTWQTNYNELSEQYNCVHIFENKGAVMGCSQPHPHGQIWAHDHMSTEIEVENGNLATYKQSENSNLFADYIKFENEQKDRVVYSNEHWLVVIPYWAAWPFETLLIAKDDVRHMGQLNEHQKVSLSDALKVLTTKYDNVFNCSFPYSMGWHSAPSNLDDDSHWRLHAHFYPPLLRSATVKKHMVGYEMLAESQRDLTAETAASILQSASTTHYKKGF